MSMKITFTVLSKEGKQYVFPAFIPVWDNFKLCWYQWLYEILLENSYKLVQQCTFILKLDYKESPFCWSCYYSHCYTHAVIGQTVEHSSWQAGSHQVWCEKGRSYRPVWWDQGQVWRSWCVHQQCRVGARCSIINRSYAWMERYDGGLFDHCAFSLRS